MTELAGFKLVDPMGIEAESFKIIARELGDRAAVRPADCPADHAAGWVEDRESSHLLDADRAPVVMRVIHATADFDYADSLVFSSDAIACGVDALRGGCSVVTDTVMALSGINKRVLARLGGEALNFIGDDDVAVEARRRGITRSAVSMERAAALGKPLVYAIGNAPTALARVCEMVGEGSMEPPALLIGVPVGFVNVVESKELALRLDVPHIVARGRKGGSTVAAAIVNALLYLASNGERG